MAFETGMAAVKTFIEEELLYGRGVAFNEKTDLIDEGVIDSLTLLRLITHIEQSCQIEIPDEEMLPENFRSLGAIQSFVERRQGNGQPAQK